jgi:hypothetical protein
MTRHSHLAQLAMIPTTFKNDTTQEYPCLLGNFHWYLRSFVVSYDYECMDMHAHLTNPMRNSER